MKSLLNALQDGRLVELPDSDKDQSLEYLAHLIEAIPDLPGRPELTEAMLAREREHNTGLGLGIACPHVRSTAGSELLCAMGWSPAGIEYGSSDGLKVHLIVMYFIPDSQKNVYLKEVSALAGALRRDGGIQAIATASDIASVRERLLDWVQAALEAHTPETRARMIRLEARQAVVEAAAGPAHAALPGQPVAAAVPTRLQTLTALFVQADGRTLVLCSDAPLATELEKDPELPALLRSRDQFSRGGWRFVFRSATEYGPRTLQEYVAIR